MRTSADYFTRSAVVDAQMAGRERDTDDNAYHLGAVRAASAMDVPLIRCDWLVVNRATLPD